MEGKYLVTTDNWFYAPDGKKYRSAWGNVTITEDNILGVKTNRMSTNWFAKIGSEEKHIIIAGCQIHYSVRCENKPNQDSVLEKCYGNGSGAETINRDSEIYIAE